MPQPLQPQNQVADHYCLSDKPRLVEANLTELPLSQQDSVVEIDNSAIPSIIRPPRLSQPPYQAVEPIKDEAPQEPTKSAPAQEYVKDIIIAVQDAEPLQLVSTPQEAEHKQCEIVASEQIESSIRHKDR